MHLIAMQLGFWFLPWSTLALSQIYSEPHDSKWYAGKIVLRFFCRNLNNGLLYGKEQRGSELHGYSDAEWVGYINSHNWNSILLFQFFRGSFRFCSRKATEFSISTSETELPDFWEAYGGYVWRILFHVGMFRYLSAPNLRVSCERAGEIDFALHESRTLRNKHILLLVHVLETL